MISISTGAIPETPISLHDHALCKQCYQTASAIQHYHAALSAVHAEVTTLKIERDHWKLLYEGKSQHG